jgi:hypothetical protein
MFRGYIFISYPIQVIFRPPFDLADNVLERRVFMEKPELQVHFLPRVKFNGSMETKPAFAYVLYQSKE